MGQGFENPPVNVGDEVDVKIEAVGEKGDGIAKKDGFVLFVPGVKEGDEVRIKITRVSRKFGFAELVGQAESKPKESAAPKKSASQEAAPAEEPTPEVSSEDSEDFGEELEAKEE